MMLNLTTILNNVIDTCFIVNKTNDTIEINELQNKIGCKKVIFQLKKKKVFAYTLDKQKSGSCRVFPFLNQQTEKISKVNDGNIVIIHNSRITILLIELKSNSYNNKDVLLKMENSKNFSNYLINVINTNYSKHYSVNDIEYKCLLFTSRLTKKGTTAGNKKIKFESKDDLLFTKLSCNREYIIDSFL